MLKTERKCTWDEIGIGEIFAWNDCFVILVKLSDVSSMCLCTDHDISQNECEGTDFGSFRTFDNLYKLPKSIQKLWKEE